jgi:hypothetical protein
MQRSPVRDLEVDSGAYPGAAGMTAMAELECVGASGRLPATTYSYPRHTGRMGL